jgi:hypothetical protein
MQGSVLRSRIILMRLQLQEEKRMQFRVYCSDFQPLAYIKLNEAKIDYRCGSGLSKE